MRLPETLTLPARKTFTPLPFSPVPPLSARMRTMRLPDTMLPSSPGPERHTWTPLLPQSPMSLWVISMPAASTLRMAACSTLVMVQSATLPEQPVSETPLDGLRVSVRCRRRTPRALRTSIRRSAAPSTW